MLGVKIGFLLIVAFLIVTMYRTIGEIRDDYARGRVGLAALGVVMEVVCLGIIIWGLDAMTRA